MIHVYLCEDNEKQKSYIEKQIRKFILIENIDMKLEVSTASPEELLDHLKDSEQTGLYFLDIDLHHSMNGLNLAQIIREYDPRGYICFITSHSEMCSLTFSYKVEAMDYILKDDYEAMRERIHECINKAYQLHISHTKINHKVLSIKAGDAYIAINFEDIQFLETSSNFHKVLLHAKNRVVEFSGSLKEIAKELDEDFYRCHRSYIVNRKNIEAIKKAEGLIYMMNGETCLLSTRHAKELLLAARFC